MRTKPVIVDARSWTTPSGVGIDDPFPTVPGLSEDLLTKALETLEECLQIMPCMPTDINTLLTNYWVLVPGHHKVALATDEYGYFLAGRRGIQSAKKRIRHYLGGRAKEIFEDIAERYPESPIRTPN